METSHARHFGKGGLRLIHGEAEDPKNSNAIPTQTRSDGTSATVGVETFSPHPIFDALESDANAKAGEVNTTPGKVSDLEVIARDPNASNDAFMDARRARAAEVAARLGMNDTPDTPPAQVIQFPRRPDDAS